MAVSPAQKRKPEHVEIVRLLLAHGAMPKDQALLSAVSEPDPPMTKVVIHCAANRYADCSPASNEEIETRIGARIETIR